MPNKQRYDINAEWDDPTEHSSERRSVSRYKTKYKIKVSTPVKESSEYLVGVSVLRNLSMRGAFVQTKHDLDVGDRPSVAVHTEVCPKEMGMPRAFWGPVEVRHRQEGKNGTVLVGVSFGEGLIQDMEFARFIEYLLSISSVMSTS